ncbi:hypothetical protein GCM10010330_24820 [Streptomyces tendae]|uniref:hypothetical protein n=1 Tax=Streptomyces tendae TaxID=1932 RepID=UPI00167193E2|nr:hypothetical protein [Streptomyces tendae]GHA71081.1 hypothetical protein GCM10010330_24820 [Streptomyces tendae]
MNRPALPETPPPTRRDPDGGLPLHGRRFDDPVTLVDSVDNTAQGLIDLFTEHGR